MTNHTPEPWVKTTDEKLLETIQSHIAPSCRIAAINTGDGWPNRASIIIIARNHDQSEADTRRDRILLAVDNHDRLVEVLWRAKHELYACGRFIRAHGDSEDADDTKTVANEIKDLLANLTPTEASHEQTD